MNSTIFSKLGQSLDTAGAEKQSSQTVKNKIQELQYSLSTISDQLNKNIKEFDLITAEKKQSIEILERNLDDIEKISLAEKDKFKEEINRSFEHNQALWNRLENDIGHLKCQQQGLRSKLMGLDSKLAEIDGQIGRGMYF